MQRRFFDNFYIAVICPIIVFWLILYSFEYPPPGIDDLSFVGTAIHYVQTGDFVNPWMAAWNERLKDRFFIQPPFHAYSLAIWLFLFGVSTKSLLLFNCLCYCIFSGFTALTLEQFKFSRWIALIIPIFYSLWMFRMGLRQDALGMAYLAVGVWFLTKDRVVEYFFGFCFLGSAFLSAPVTIAYSIPFSSALIGYNLSQSKQPRNRYLALRSLALIGAVITIFTVLLFCLNFRLNLFLSDMAWHSSFRRQSLVNALPVAFWIVTIGFGEVIYGSLYGLYIILLNLLLLKKRLFSSKVRVFILTLTIALILNLFIYASTVTGIFNFFCWVGIVTLVAEAQIRNRSKIIVIALCLFVFLLNNSLNFITILGSERGSEATYRTAREFVNNNPNRKYVMDSYAVRFAFDYKPPAGIIDWTFSSPAPLAQPLSLANKPADVVYIVSPTERGGTQGFPDSPRIELFGYRFESLVRKPYDLLIIE
ncbi:hypothetical protein [Oscillatoria sp. FACHB-1406]|uniref:hypothetical protein n=1 Tax=Oscillatoria sp. FACHB-1406 TaxID=2692846 RepID=UPI00168654DB|nr:hypothetical protein [Oscillatoria sp. FACHB-1406]MBD2578099.1 hypothetical protein [Oscillatoria sp. FACHB-1406]